MRRHAGLALHYCLILRRAQPLVLHRNVGAADSRQEMATVSSEDG
jgi:hypothetical protein